MMCLYVYIEFVSNIYKSVTNYSAKRNVSVLSDLTSKIWADFAKDWHKIGILQ
jgi:hypothetical protein